MFVRLYAILVLFLAASTLAGSAERPIGKIVVAVVVSGLLFGLGMGMYSMAALPSSIRQSLIRAFCDVGTCIARLLPPMAVRRLSHAAEPCG